MEVIFNRLKSSINIFFLLFMVALFFLHIPSSWAQYVEEEDRQEQEKVPQEEKNEASSYSMSSLPLKERIFFNSGFGFSLGNNQTNISIAPTVGYRVTERFSVGPGFSYSYFKIRDVPSISLYGYKAFAQYMLSESVSINALYENINYQNFTTQGEERLWEDGLFLGAGYYFPIGNRSGIQIQALYNVLWRQPHPFYPQPYVIQLGLNFGIFPLN